MIKKTVVHSEEVILNYPVLMFTDDNEYIIMVDKCEGFMLPATSDYKNGCYSKHWDMEEFKKLDGSITLSNI